METRNKTSPNRQAGTLDSTTRLTRHPVSTPPSPLRSSTSGTTCPCTWTKRRRSWGWTRARRCSWRARACPSGPAPSSSWAAGAARYGPRSRRRPTTRTASSAFWARSWWTGGRSPSARPCCWAGTRGLTRMDTAEQVSTVELFCKTTVWTSSVRPQYEVVSTVELFCKTAVGTSSVRPQYEVVSTAKLFCKTTVWTSSVRSQYEVVSTVDYSVRPQYEIFL